MLSKIRVRFLKRLRISRFRILFLKWYFSLVLGQPFVAREQYNRRLQQCKAKLCTYNDARRMDANGKKKKNIDKLTRGTHKFLLLRVLPRSFGQSRCWFAQHVVCSQQLDNGNIIRIVATDYLLVWREAHLHTMFRKTRAVNCSGHFHKVQRILSLSRSYFPIFARNLLRSINSHKFSFASLRSGVST